MNKDSNTNGKGKLDRRIQVNVQKTNVYLLLARRELPPGPLLVLLSFLAILPSLIDKLYKKNMKHISFISFQCTPTRIVIYTLLAQLIAKTENRADTEWIIKIYLAAISSRQFLFKYNKYLT